MKPLGDPQHMRPVVADGPPTTGLHARPACRRALIALCIAAGGLAGCATTPPPAGEIATARAALDAARREGASQHAATALGDAEDRLARAERAGTARDYGIARRLAEEARVTAEVAAESARLAKARTARDALERSSAGPPAATGAAGATTAPVTSSTVVPVSPPAPEPPAATGVVPASPGVVPASPAVTVPAPSPAMPAPAPGIPASR